MNSRVWIAGLLGGLVIFAWGAVSHLALGTWNDAFEPLPNEAALLDSMKRDMPAAGTYAFPWLDPGDEADERKMAAFQQKLAEGPSGILVYRPGGVAMMSPAQLGIEFLSNVLQALICAFLLSRIAAAVPSYLGRAAFVGLMGLLPPLSISVSYWNWDGFSRGFTTAEFLDQVVSFFFAGLVMAALLKPRA